MNDTLRIKTYFASSIDAALALASRELGPEAMLLNTRPSPPEARHLGLYEAVFATVPPPPATPVPSPVAVQMSDLGRLSAASLHELQEAGIDPNLAQQIIAAQPASLEAHMESLIVAEPVIARSVSSRETVAFVGPPGRGKTTTLLKLAITHGLAVRKPVRIFSADYLRAGASLTLRSMAGILGVSFEFFSSPATLDHALRQPRAGLTLIDTPGFTPADHDSAVSLARMLTAHTEVDTHVVMRADSSTSAMAVCLERFQPFRPKRVLFTGLDEVSCAGAVFSLAAISRLPVSFLGNGQSIPDDLEPASTARIVELALGAERHAGVFAA